MIGAVLAIAVTIWSRILRNNETPKVADQKRLDKGSANLLVLLNLLFDINLRLALHMCKKACSYGQHLPTRSIMNKRV